MGKIRKRADFIVRTAIGVPLSFLNDAGEIVKENFDIKFRSYSATGWNRVMAAAGITDPEAFVPYATMFAQQIVSIVDSDGQAITDDTGEPAALTREFYDEMLTTDLQAIQEALANAVNPPTPSPSPGPSGSSPAASEA